MPFLRGSLSFERFRVHGFDAQLFNDEHMERLGNHVAGKVQTDSEENAHIGFLGGDHLFDQHFDLGKNVINGALHAGVRIDTNQVPAAIRNAWLQIELAGLQKDAANGKITKAMRQEAKDAVEERCRAEAATGKYRKMSSAPWLWDPQRETFYFSGSGPAAAHCADLVERAFDLELHRMSAGSIALDWATETDRFAEVDDLIPATFVNGQGVARLPWTNEYSQSPDFLGNEFLLWLWWFLDNENDTIELRDEGRVTAMFSKSLTLECPLGENGKETISAECPVRLPEAMQGVRSGKLPRRAGLTLARDGMRFDLVLQAESFAIGSAKISSEDDEKLDADDRINAIRFLVETVDELFISFCQRRISEQWESDLSAIRTWLEGTNNQGQIAA